jgi:hypothetical protein
MKWFRQHWRPFARIAGSLLILIGLFFAYWWFYKLAPWNRTCDPGWRAAHSEQEFWREVQKGIRRGMWGHDDGFAVGLYGDKSWAEWIMTHVRPGKTMNCLGADLFHSATAMRLITNQNAGEDADVWLDWWRKNSSKSQLQWIADGFQQQGIQISTPPKPAQIPALLTLLGTAENDDSSTSYSHLKYNAFRCLRDSGFEPVEFTLANRTRTAEVERGLFKYVRREHRMPAATRLGILPFVKTAEDETNDHAPEFLTPKFQAIAYALIFGPLLTGVALTLWSFLFLPRSTE